MLNKLLAFLRKYRMLEPGDHLVCAVSGGADSIALLFAMYLLKEKLQITVAAAHFNHHLRGEESERDEQFVRQFCARYDIALSVGSANVVAGKKGLEAAAREARYAFFKTLEGKIATAHTANDNAETMLMHLIRGTGLKGLGSIAPINGALIRPMLDITRAEVLDFIAEYNLTYVTDSSNHSDQFLRNRLRHHVMPLLVQENPKLAENLSSLALRLQQDEKILAQLSEQELTTDIVELRQMPEAVRSRVIAAFLERCGVREAEAAHIRSVEGIIFSANPSAKAYLPNGIVICRNYNKLEQCTSDVSLQATFLPCPGELSLEAIGLKIVSEQTNEIKRQKDCFTISPRGDVRVRSRVAGDKMRVSGGTKELKKLFIDNKIPAIHRETIPVLSDDDGILGVYGLGANLARSTEEGTMFLIRFIKL